MRMQPFLLQTREGCRTESNHWNIGTNVGVGGLEIGEAVDRELGLGLEWDWRVEGMGRGREEGKEESFQVAISNRLRPRSHRQLLYPVPSPPTTTPPTITNFTICAFTGVTITSTLRLSLTHARLCRGNDCSHRWITNRLTNPRCARL